jgi:type IV secretory pathway VirB2 component (pilin)
MDQSAEPSAAVAVNWIVSLLTGSAATALSVVAIAGVGALLLQGRVDVRRGVTVILGCFIIFGAPSIATGILSATRDTNTAPSIPPSAAPVYPAAPSTPPAQNQPSHDPYAGAALPQR